MPSAPDTKKAKSANNTKPKGPSLLQQYHQLRQQYPHVLLMVRVGEFYEFLYEDALLVSKTLGITLTRRRNKDADVPMCGVPASVREKYVAQLVRHGHKIAICEEVTQETGGDEKNAQKPTNSTTKDHDMLQRRMVRLITPGTYVSLEEDGPACIVLLAIYMVPPDHERHDTPPLPMQQPSCIRLGLAPQTLALATYHGHSGDIWVETCALNALESALERLRPLEILVCAHTKEALKGLRWSPSWEALLTLVPCEFFTSIEK